MTAPMEYKLTYLARIALLLMLTVGVYLAAVEGGPVAAANLNDKIVHLAAFVVLALCADYAFPRHRFDWFTILPLLGYGLLIEIMQVLYCTAASRLRTWQPTPLAWPFMRRVS